MANEDWALFFGDNSSPRRDSQKRPPELDDTEGSRAKAPFPLTPTKSLPALAVSNAVTAAVALPTGRESQRSIGNSAGSALPVSDSIGDQNLLGGSMPSSTLSNSVRSRTNSATVQGSESPSLKPEEIAAISFDRKKAEALFSPLPGLLSSFLPSFPLLAHILTSLPFSFLSSFSVSLESLPTTRPNRRHRRVLSKDGRDLTFLNWRPEGTLVAHLVEHRGAVTHIAIAKDFAFFLTGSDDGTVKVWDCQRLEKNVSNRSRLTYNPLGGKVTALTFLENTHCFAVAGTSGTVHLCKVECFSKDNGIPKYGKCVQLQKFELDEGHVIAIDHYSQGELSVLVFVTSLGVILAYDLKTGGLLWTLNHPISEGKKKKSSKIKKEEFIAFSDLI